MKKLLLSAIIVSLMLIIPFAPLILSGNGGDDGTYQNDTPVGDVGELTLDKQSGDPYFIYTPADMAYLAQRVNAGDPLYKDKEYLLNNDIDLSAYGGSFNYGRGWIPIGTDNYPFSGTFDGNGKKITGLYIRNPVTDTIGLFGRITGGIVKDVGLVDVNITGRNNTGAVSGYADTADVSGCYVTGIVMGNNFVGGIIGLQESGSAAACSFVGSVSGIVYTGGITGNLQNGTIASSRSSGMVIGRAADAGGIAGNVANGTVVNCYYSGKVEVRSENGGAGGIAGHLYSGTVTNCAVVGTAVIGSKDAGRVVGGIYSTAIPSKMSGNRAFDGIIGSGIWSDIGAAGRDGMNATAADTTTAGFFEGIFNNDPTWEYGGGELPGLFGRTEGIPVWIQTPRPLNDGLCYSIYTAEDLVWVAERINSGAAGYGGNYYFLENDIDIFAYGSQNANFGNGNGWIPIGRSGDPFSGVFDGQGYEIAGLDIEAHDLDGAGLFGSISGELIRIGLVNANVTGYDNVGGLAGYSDGDITDCYVTGTVSGNDNVGGVAGYSAGSITRTYSTSAVSGIDKVGGIAGSIGGGSVTDCAALGPSVIGTSNTGRVAGYSAGGTLSGNIAFDDMIGGPWISGADGTDGADVSIPDIKPAGFFENILGTEGAWTYGLCELPGLLPGRTVDTPAHLLLHAEAPVITQGPTDTTVVQGNSDKSLTVTAASPDGGTLSYQWYRNDVNSYAGAVPAEGDGASHSPDTSMFGTYYYFVVVTNTNDSIYVDGSQTASSTSGRAKLTIDFRVDAEKPTIIDLIYPDNGTVNKDEKAALTVYAGASDVGEDGGTLTYQWFGSTDGTQFHEIPEGTDNTYTIPTDSVGRTYYYVTVTNTNGNVNGTQTASAESIGIQITVVVNAMKPIITVPPAGDSVDLGGYLELSVTASAADEGTLSYQWYRDGDEIEGATDPKYTVPTDVMGTFYYSVIVTNTIPGEFVGERTATATSGTVMVKVIVNALMPAIDIISGGGYHNEGDPVGLTVTASAADGGTLSYQWFRNDVDDVSSGTLIPGAVGTTYVATTGAPGDPVFYYVEVTNTNYGVNGETTATAVSGTIWVEGKVNAKAPSITAQPAGGQVVRGGSFEISVTAVAEGDLSYQWYVKGIGEDEFVQISGATSVGYNVPTGEMSSYYYYVVVTNTITDNGDGGMKTASAASITIMVKVFVDAETPFIDEQPTGGSAVEGGSFVISVTATVAEGDLSYQWYSNASDDIMDGSPISDANYRTYAVPTDVPGTYYYYVIITNTNENVNGKQTETKESEIVTVTIEVRVDAGTPFIDTQPTDVTKNELGASADLTVTATSPDDGTLSYQWYSNSVKSNTGGSPISDANDNTYTAPTGVQGTIYYYVIVTNTNVNVNGTQTASVTSDAVTVAVIINAKKPVINEQPTGGEFKEGSTVTLSVSAVSEDGGILSYQWYRTADGEGGTPISRATGYEYTAPTNTMGTMYYFVIVTNTNVNVNGTQTAPIKSDVVSVETIVDAKDPVITGQPHDVTIQIDGTANLTVTAASPDGGTLSYQWYSNSVKSNTGGSLIPGATGASYQLPTDVEGDYYYYVEVTNTKDVNGNGTATIKSDPVTVTVNELINAEAPVIDDQPEGGQAVRGGSFEISVTATVAEGDLSYQWYGKGIGEDEFGPISGATSAGYNVPTGEMGSLYYYVVVTNTITDNGDGGMKTASAASITIMVKVFVDAEKPFISEQPAGGSAVEGGSFVISVTATVGEGDLSYQWYSNASDDIMDGSPISDANNRTYAVPTDVPGTYYYYVIITNTNENVNGEQIVTEKSDIVTVTIEVRVDAGTPFIDTQPTDVTVNELGAIAVLTVTATSPDDGTLSYQWYSNSVKSNTGGSPISDANDNTYTAPTGVQGSIYYYVIVTNTNVDVNGTQTASVTSDAVAVAVIINAEKPEITGPAGGYFNEGDPAELTVSATIIDGGVLTYRWYRSTNDTTWTLIPGAAAATYVATTGAPGTTMYYYVTVTNTNVNVNGTTTSSVTSGTVTVTGNINAKAPVMTVQPAGGSVNEGNTGPTLSVTAETDDGGSLTYQWYGGVNADALGPISGATENEYTVPTNVMGTFYYYVEVKNTIPPNGDGGIKTETTKSITVSVKVIVNAETPFIDEQPAGGSYDEGSTAALSVTATVTAGDLKYQWYRSTDGTTWTLIPGATGSTYNAPTNVMGTMYYYVVITNVDNEVNGERTASVPSGAAEVITIFNAKTPSITSQPAGGSFAEGVVPVLRVSAAVTDDGTLTYQWYRTSDIDTAGTPISEATSPSYSVPAGVQSEYYYYVIITNTNGDVNGSKTTTIKSNIVLVKVVFNAKAPSITAQPIGDTVDKGDPYVTVSVTATASGTLSYQWYSNTVNNNVGGTLLYGETNSTLNAPTDRTGRTFYYVVVTNTDASVNGMRTAAVTSNAAAVTVRANAEMPQIDEWPADTTAHVGDVVILTVNASVNDNGTLKYQWYSNTSNTNIGGTLIEGAERRTFEVPTGSVGIVYYYVEITNTIPNNGYVHNMTETNKSDAAEVTVLIKAKAPIISTQPLDGTAVEGNTITLNVGAGSADGGALTYQWYVMTEGDIEGTPIGGATGARFTSDALAPGTFYYYVKVTNRISSLLPFVDPDMTEASIFSNVITVIVDIRADAKAPDIESIEGSDTYVGGVAFLAVTAISPDGGKLTYRWYSSTDGEIWSYIPGANTSMYRIPTSAAGKIYYLAEVTNTNNSVNGTPMALARSDPVSVTVWIKAGTPEITGDPEGDKVDPGAEVILNVSISDPGDGIVTYQWYSNTTNTNIGGSPIPDATASSYGPPTSADGTYYYYVVVTNTIPSGTFVDEENRYVSVTSDTAKIVVMRNAGSPVIDGPPAGGTVAQNRPFELSITAASPDAGTLIYLWYSNTTNTNIGGTPIPGAIGPSYAPSTSSPGTFYFYVTVTNTISDNGDGGVKTVTVTSGAVAVVVQQLVNAQTPNVSPSTFPKNAAVEPYESYPMKVTATVTDGGTLTYQWFLNTENSKTGGTLIMYATEDTYEHRAGSAGTYYYYVEITNTNASVNGVKTATTVSNVIIVKVAEPPAPYSDDDEKSGTELPMTVIAAAAAGGIAAVAGAGYLMMRRKP